jgi:hypothetical protein
MTLPDNYLDKHRYGPRQEPLLTRRGIGYAARGSR